jgi:hypothetical protein
MARARAKAEARRKSKKQSKLMDNYNKSLESYSAAMASYEKEMARFLKGKQKSIAEPKRPITPEPPTLLADPSQIVNGAEANFLALAAAIKIFTARSLTDRDIERARSLLIDYLLGFKRVCCFLITPQNNLLVEVVR